MRATSALQDQSAEFCREQPSLRVLVAGGVAIVLLPYWLALIQHPIHQIPIPHDSRANFLLNSITGVNYFLIPYGALILALPFIVIRGASNPRWRPLLFGFWLTLIFGLGGTTPLPRWLLGRAFEILTFERFTFWATLHGDAASSEFSQLNSSIVSRRKPRSDLRWQRWPPLAPRCSGSTPILFALPAP